MEAAKKKSSPNPSDGTMATMSDALSALYDATWPRASELLVPYDQSMGMWRLHLMMAYGMPYAVIARRMRDGDATHEELEATLASDIREVADSMRDARSWRRHGKYEVIGSVIRTGHAKMLGTPKWNPPEYPVEPWARAVGSLEWLEEPSDGVIDAYLAWVSTSHGDGKADAGEDPGS